VIGRALLQTLTAALSKSGAADKGGKPGPSPTKTRKSQPEELRQGPPPGCASQKAQLKARAVSQEGWPGAEKPRASQEPGLHSKATVHVLL
jgi:hypothetical protein